MPTPWDDAPGQVRSPGWRLEHTYASLPALFHARAAATPVRSPRIVVLNRGLAAALGLDGDALDTPEGAAVLAGNALPDGAQPLAMAYAGHQFGHFTGLGDGRALLLGEQITAQGVRVDVQLKGAGQTRYSRRGDGRAALGPMLREYLVSEAMHGLGIPTTRSLAVVATGEPVHRERVLAGAVLTRVAASHLRVGTFEWAAAHKDAAALRALAEYTRQRHFPDIPEGPDAPAALFEAVAARQAQLIARWQLVGFIHGVMNTDNMALAGETIDYGPCAFMDAYDPATVFSSIDVQGRYAYGNQPAIAQWNLARLAEAMLPLLADTQEAAVERANAALDAFATQFDAHWQAGLRAKLGLFAEGAGDAALAADLLDWMHRRGADFTNTWRGLATAGFVEQAAQADAEFAAWRDRWMARRAAQPQPPAEVEALMRRSSPAVIARNHKVEEALDAAAGGDLAPFHALLDVLSRPYDDGAPEGFTQPVVASGYRTFCGT
jgi:uncharacterized protein YdiU (UPF0061 family)